MFEKNFFSFRACFISKRGGHWNMNGLRLFNFGRRADIWRQMLRYVGRRNRRRGGTMLTVLGLSGLGIVAALGMRRGGNNRGMMQRPIQQAMSRLNRFMNNTRRPNLSPVELAQEIMVQPNNMQSNNQSPTQK
jgi:hypothetical protein